MSSMPTKTSTLSYGTASAKTPHKASAVTIESKPPTFLKINN